MISRKKIILKSEDLATNENITNKSVKIKNNTNSSEDEFFNEDFADENTWFSLEQLISDQISEIINKWSAIDDEIWGKVVCFERNRRIAKVYARSQVLSVSGSECDFDGSRIGLNAFPNGRRDEETASIKRQIKSGFKLKIDDLGNLYIKRVGKCAVYIATGEDCLQQNSPNIDSKNTSQKQSNPVTQQKPVHFRSLEPNTALTIFDMRSFLASITDWSARHPSVRYPPADFLERFHQKCVHLIQVVVKEDGTGNSKQGLLRHPCWIVLVNIVGLDLLWSRFGYSSMILLNQHQLVSLRSSFALGGPKNNPQNKSYHSGSTDKMATHGKNSNGRRHPDSDDLYYSGYKAKISSHSAGVANSRKLPSTKLPISSSSTLLLNFAANRNDFLCAPPFHQNGNQFYYNNGCQFNTRNGNGRNDRSQIPQLIIGSKREFSRSSSHGFGGANSITPHHRRLARSSTHLHFSTPNSTGCTSNSTSTSEDNCGLTSSSSLEELTSYLPSSSNSGRYGHNNNGSCSKLNNNVCDKKKFKSSNSKTGSYVQSAHSRRIYTRNQQGRHGETDSRFSRRLGSMKKLSTSNLELSSGTFYDLEEESSLYKQNKIDKIFKTKEKNVKKSNSD